MYLKQYRHSWAYILQVHWRSSNCTPWICELSWGRRGSWAVVGRGVIFPTSWWRFRWRLIRAIYLAMYLLKSSVTCRSDCWSILPRLAPSTSTSELTRLEFRAFFFKYLSGKRRQWYFSSATRMRGVTGWKTHVVPGRSSRRSDYTHTWHI